MATLAEIVLANAEGASSIGAYDEDIDERTYDYCQEVREAAKQAGLAVCFDYGATQLCFIDHDNKDYVIKVPFIHKAGYYYDHDDDDNEITVDYDEPYSHNYTADCADIYERAVSAGIAMFFARVESLGNNIWKQEYVYAICGKGSPRSHSDEEMKEIRKMIKENFWHSLNPAWVADCIFYYGRDAFEKFIQFIDDECINDLHEGNYGYSKNGYPRLLDYSGYYENSSSSSY